MSPSDALPGPKDSWDSCNCGRTSGLALDVPDYSDTPSVDRTHPTPTRLKLIKDQDLRFVQLAVEDFAYLSEPAMRARLRFSPLWNGVKQHLALESNPGARHFTEPGLTVWGHLGPRPCIHFICQPCFQGVKSGLAQIAADCRPLSVRHHNCLPRWFWLVAGLECTHLATWQRIVGCSLHAASLNSPRIRANSVLKGPDETSPPSALRPQSYKPPLMGWFPPYFHEFSGLLIQKEEFSGKTSATCNFGSQYNRLRE